MAISVFDPLARTATANSKNIGTQEYRGGIFTLDVTAASGTTPTLDVKIQHYSPVADKYLDIPGAAFAQKTGVTQDTLVLYPGATVAANRSISTVVGDEFRAVATIGGTTPSFTFSVGFQGVR